MLSLSDLSRVKVFICDRGHVRGHARDHEQAVVQVLRDEGEDEELASHNIIGNLMAQLGMGQL